MSAPTWDTLRGAIEKMVAYPAGDGWHVSREAADKALEWIGWAETHQPSPVPKLLSEEDEDLSLVWRTVDGWAIHRTFPSDGEPYWLAMPARTPEVLAASPEVAALIAEARREGWNAAIEASAALVEGSVYTSNGGARTLEPVSPKMRGMDMHHATIASAIRALKETTRD